jgi:putative ABC transport system permease protein
VALGLVGALWVTRSMQSLLFDVQPGDPATLAAVMASLVAVALVASAIPARRALRIDPGVAMRPE